MFKNILLCISLLCASSFANDSNKDLLASQKQNIGHFIGFSEVDSTSMLKMYGSFVVDTNKKVNYAIYYREGDEKLLELVEKHIIGSSEVFFDLAKFRELNTKSCKPVDHLQIFIISLVELNSRAVARTIKIQEGDYLVGLFDPILDRPRTANIFLAGQQYETFNVEIISHEMSHYWFHRLCWKNYADEIDDEIYALVFGSFYSRIHTKGMIEKND